MIDERIRTHALWLFETSRGAFIRARRRFRRQVAPRLFGPVGIGLAIALVAGPPLLGLAVFLPDYLHYSAIVDDRIRQGLMHDPIEVYAGAHVLETGQKVTRTEIVERLERAGYLPAATVLGPGVYRVGDSSLHFDPDGSGAVAVEFDETGLTRIARGGEDLDRLMLPSELVTSISDRARAKRRLIGYDELPAALRQALLASEDRRFFSHSGIDPIRVAGAFVANVRKGEWTQGASTLTQQLAKNFFLNPERSFRRKTAEAMIALALERRLDKQSIFTLYANEVYLGHRGTFGIHGFGEAASAYFGRSVERLTLAEAALLVGIIPAPNAYSPEKHPERALARRNMVLRSMREEEMITRAELDMALEAPVELAPVRSQLDLAEAPYFIDYVRSELASIEMTFALAGEGLQIHTTVDPVLQRIAVEAVEAGLARAEQEIIGRLGPDRAGDLPPMQATLVVLDPATGAIRAMVGGRDYQQSQFNRAIRAQRHPGSVFKPFVYAAAFEAELRGEVVREPLPIPVAMNTASEGDLGPGADETRNGDEVELEPNEPILEPISPITPLIDRPTVFPNGDEEPYEPSNYGEDYTGVVTLRTALERSLNVPTVRLAEQIGYDRIAKLARRAGLPVEPGGYPAMALGAFETTPLEMAAAYCAFANGGYRVRPHAITSVYADDGITRLMARGPEERQQILSPEVVYLMNSLLEGVVTRGTGARVRSLGVRGRVAGKTGTSRDGWFAGYTGNLLAVAWVGFDDYEDLRLEGARSALPIWAEFMSRAAGRGKVATAARPAPPPAGIEQFEIDPDTSMLATPFCARRVREVFLAGTAPQDLCFLHGGVLTERR